MFTQLKALQDRRAQEGEEGFTLIELLIVIVVLGILAAVVVFALGSVTGNAKASACNANAKTIQTAVSAFDAYPPSNCSGVTCTIGVEVSGTAAGDITLGTPSTYSTGTQAEKLWNFTGPSGYTQVLTTWPQTSSDGYALSLSTATAGDVEIYIPYTSAVGTSYNAETSSTGCNSL